MNRTPHKHIGILLIFLFSTTLFLHAEEGMWFLPLIEELNSNSLKQTGCELNASDIYSLNQGSLKDAIVLFNGNCTGEIVSEEGLLFTNHHCAFSQIQNLSTVEKNYLNEGFWAMSKDEELINQDLHVAFLIHIEDVTQRIVKELSPRMAEYDRHVLIKRTSKEIIKEVTDSSSYQAEVKSFFSNNKYYLLVYAKYTDVRLVGAPPTSIAKFGFDTDNWMWPRHSADFSIFRVYSAPDGSPADYSPENIPLKTKNYLKISIGGYKPEDFTMTLGYPGTTKRNSTSSELETIAGTYNPTRAKIRNVRQQVLLDQMKENEELFVKYASKYYKSSNYWKYSIGQNKAFNRLNVIDLKKETEIEFQKWVESDSSRNVEYGKVFSGLDSLFKARLDAQTQYQYINECFLKAVDMTRLSQELPRLDARLDRENPDETKIKSEIERLSKYSKKHFSENDKALDQKVAEAIFELYLNDINPEDYPDIFVQIQSRYKGDIKQYLNKVYAKSFLVDSVKFSKFLKKPSLKKLESDLGYLIGRSIYYKKLEVISEYFRYKYGILRLQRLYLQAILEKDSTNVFYPDANLTMRMSYGKISDVKPADATWYAHQTSLSGLFEKEDSMQYGFKVPASLKTLFQNKDYGRYGQDGIMPLCFISTNDITGGSSGSPVLNSKGEMIGIAFDTNWEGLAGDYQYSESHQRCVSVDIRYVLFIIEKYAGADYLLHELSISTN